MLVEASRLGFTSIGIDIDPAAVEVSRASLDLACGKCSKEVLCLREAIEASQEAVGGLWRMSDDSLVVHVFLARCSNGCQAPALLSGDPRKRAIIIDPSTPTWLREVSNAPGYTPTEPLVDLPAGLPEAAPGYRIYAIQAYRDGYTRFIVLPSGSRDSEIAWEWAQASLEEALERAPETCTRIPVMRETRKLIRRGIECWEQLYTPRQLATLYMVLENASRLGCRRWAGLALADATRTCSLLALYYQPYRRVNPGLVLKTYWLPRYPVELNPLAGAGGRTLARGTLYSIASHLAGSCKGGMECGRYTVIHGDARERAHYPDRIDLVLTDPPYPGMMSYEDLSLPYRYWLAHRLSTGWGGLLGGRVFLRLMEDFIDAVKDKLAGDARIIILFNSGPSEVETMARAVALLSGKGWSLSNIYWLPSEAPGTLGRSRHRGVYVAVHRQGPPPRDPLGGLRRTSHILELLRLGPLEGQLDSRVEVERAEKLISMLEGFLEDG